MSLNESGIELNNRDKVLDKFEREPFQDEVSTIGINGGVLDTPLITDENITNNSNFIVNLFNNEDKPKTYKLK